MRYSFYDSWGAERRQEPSLRGWAANAGRHVHGSLRAVKTANDLHIHSNATNPIHEDIMLTIIILKQRGRVLIW